MKYFKILIAVTIGLLLCSLFSYAEMPTITLDTPENITNPATTYRLQGVYLGRGPTIKAYYWKVDAGSNVVSQVECALEDWDNGSCSNGAYTTQATCESAEEVWTPNMSNDLTTLYTAVIGAGAVGSGYIDKIARAIDPVCRGAHYLNAAGTSD